MRSLAILLTVGPYDNSVRNRYNPSPDREAPPSLCFGPVPGNP